MRGHWIRRKEHRKPRPFPDKKKGTSKAPPVSGFLARFRGLLQACAVLLTNPHLPNLWKGQIYRGKGKTVCVPGLNCYSCPAATGACPIGAIQSVIGSSKFKFSYYVTGTLILLGVLLGRFVCGFGQGFRDMSPPTKELMRIVLEHRLNHGGHPVLRWNFDNAYVRTDPAGNLKLDKEKSTEKIDGAVALVMALDRAMKNQNGSDSVYDERGLLLL